MTVATFKSVPDMKKRVTASGNHFFEPFAMAFWNSKVEGSLVRGAYFVTSEYMDNPAETRYSARYFTEPTEPGTAYEEHLIGEFQAYETAIAAWVAIDDHLRNAHRRDKLLQLLEGVGLKYGIDPESRDEGLLPQDGEHKGLYLLADIPEDGRSVELIEGNLVTHIPVSDFSEPWRFAQYVRQQVDAKIADWVADD